MDGKDALRAIAAFRLAMPRTVLRYAGGRELTLGDLGTREGLLGGINAVIVGNYLTTLGRPADGRPQPAGRAEHAHQGTPEDAMNGVSFPNRSTTGVSTGSTTAEFCGHCGEPSDGGARPTSDVHRRCGNASRWNRRGTAPPAGAG